MTLPKDVAEAVAYGDECWIDDSDPDQSATWQTIRAHILSQDAEIARQKSITNIICEDVSAALLRAGFEDVDGPGEAIDIIRERAELTESRLAAADALLRECKSRISELCRVYGNSVPKATFDRIAAHLSENTRG